MRIDFALQSGDFVAQCEPPFFEPAQQQLVVRHGVCQAIDTGIEIGMFHAKVDQLAGEGMKIEIQCGATRCFTPLVLFAR